MGESVITITYIDSVTSAEFNVTFTLEILSRSTYKSYLAKGIVKEPETITNAMMASTESSTQPAKSLEEILAELGIT